MFTRGLRELKEKNRSIREATPQIRNLIPQYIKSIFLETKLLDIKNKHIQFNPEDLTENENFFLMKNTKIQPTAPKETLLYPNISTLTEKMFNEAAIANEWLINNGTKVNNYFNNKNKILKDI